MVLGDRAIQQMIEAIGLVAGYDDRLIGPASIDLRLGHSFATPMHYDLVTLGAEIEYKEWKPCHECPHFTIRPGEFVLATTLERVHLPRDIAAFVQGRSSIGRIGLTTQNAGFVDPGFDGHITLELVNESENPIELVPGYPVAQLVFFDTRGVTNPYAGKYNGQVEATGSRMYLDDPVEVQNGEN